MSWLFQNPIADMPGPQFLLFYGTVIVITVVACWLARRAADPTRELGPPPVPAQPDPYEIAYLRGGENEVVRLGILGLIQRGYLQAMEGGEDASADPSEGRITHAPNHPDPRHLNPLERSLFAWFSAPQKPADIFESPDLRAKVQAHCLAYENQLKSQRLLMPPEARQAAWAIGVAAALLLLAVGGYKLAVALMRGRRNIGFLILLGLLCPVLVALACRSPRLSHRGQAYLDRLRMAFERLKERAISLAGGGADPALLLLVGLFGVGVLAGTSYDSYQRMFHRAASRGGSCGGGCGSCGGGSGGSCGGGCGGCGGGGD